MKPYGREKKLQGTGAWKKDAHPKKGFVNWWENMCDFYSRGRIKQIWKKDVENIINNQNL